MHLKPIITDMQMCNNTQTSKATARLRTSTHTAQQLQQASLTIHHVCVDALAPWWSTAWWIDISCCRFVGLQEAPLGHQWARPQAAAPRQQGAMCMA